MAKHPGSIDRHGASWRVRLYVGGQRYVFLRNGSTKGEAEQFAREKDTELRRRNGRGLPGPMPVSELLDRYEEVLLPERAPRTQETYGHSLQAARTYFVEQGGDPGTHEVRPGHVQDFLYWRRTRSPDGTTRKTPLTPRSLAKDRAVLHAVFAFAEMLEVVQGNPVRNVPPPKGDSREPLILSAEQYEALLAACDGNPMLYLYVLVLGETGVRCESEALWLRWQDVDLDRGFLTVESVRKGRRTKSGKARVVPMTARLREAVQMHRAAYRLRTYHGKRTPWIFHHETDRRHSRAEDQIGRLYRAFANAANRACLPEDLNQHDLRHRRVTTWIAEGKSPALIQKAMGHSALATTMRYTHLVSEDLLALVAEPEERALRALVDR